MDNSPKFKSVNKEGNNQTNRGKRFRICSEKKINRARRIKMMKD